MRPWLLSGAAASVAALVAAVAVVAGPGEERRAAAAALSPSASPEAVADDQQEIVVFLCTPSTYGCDKRETTQKQKRALKAFLDAMPELTEVTFLDRAGTYEAFKRDFAANRPLLKKVKAEDLPESFRLRVKPGVDRRRVRVAVGRRPGVSGLEDPLEVHGGSASTPARSDATVFMCTKSSAMPACTSGRGKANNKAATPDEKKAIIAALDTMPGIESYVFEDQRTAYQHFSRTFADNKVLISATKVSDMPESYRLMLYPDADWSSITGRLARMPGVSQASNQRCLETLVKLYVEYGFFGPETDDLDSVACAPGAG